MLDTMAIEKQQFASDLQEKLDEQSSEYEGRLKASQEHVGRLQGEVERLSKLEDELKSLNRLQAKLAVAEEQRNSLTQTMEKQREEHENEMKVCLVQTCFRLFKH